MPILHKSRIEAGRQWLQAQLEKHPTEFGQYVLAAYLPFDEDTPKYFAMYPEWLFALVEHVVDLPSVETDRSKLQTIGNNVHVVHLSRRWRQAILNLVYDKLDKLQLKQAG